MPVERNLELTWNTKYKTKLEFYMFVMLFPDGEKFEIVDTDILNSQSLHNKLFNLLGV